MDRREALIEVFQDTQAFYRENETLARAVETACLGSVLYGPGDCPPLPEEGERTLMEGQVEVSRRRSFEAAVDIHKRHPKARIGVLNFASATRPGGGVKRGSSAQEECLCRCSTLYPALDQRRMWDGYYAPNRAAGDRLHTDACIYTPGVVICKTDEDLPQRLDPGDFVTVDVITCAAPDLRPTRDGASVQKACGDGGEGETWPPDMIYWLLFHRACQILRVAAANGVDALVLGAFGCGVFCNDPRMVALAFFRALERYRSRFDLVEFAIYCPGEGTENFDAFAYLKKLSRGGDEAVAILPQGENARKQYGMGYGSQLVQLNPWQVGALRAGKQLAIRVMDEYVVFLQGPKDEATPGENG